MHNLLAILLAICKKHWKIIFGDEKKNHKNDAYQQRGQGHDHNQEFRSVWMSSSQFIRYPHAAAEQADNKYF